MAMALASVVFLCSLTLTLFLPSVCYYDVNNEKRGQPNEYNIQMVDTRTQPAAASQRHTTFQERLTVRKLKQNISQLSQELRQYKIAVRIYEKLGKLMEKDSSLASFGNKFHQNVLLTSVPHSGSEFLGELFNQNRDIFYLFEPFHSLKFFRENRPPEIYDSMVSSFLLGIFSCDFSKFHHFTEFLSRQYRALPHRLSSRTLASPPLCPKVIPGLNYNIRLCSYLRPPMLSAICNLHAHTVVKTTQIIDLERLGQLTDWESEPVFRVVELVRDPRAIVYTLLQEGLLYDNVTESFFTHESRKVCIQQLRNLKYAQNSRLGLKDRYILVKYEDLISKPVHALDELYSFLGMLEIARAHSLLAKVLRDGFTWPAVLNNDGTTGELMNNRKNLTRSLKEWQTSLKEFQIRLIEQECLEIMSLLDYKIFQRNV